MTKEELIGLRERVEKLEILLNRTVEELYNLAKLNKRIINLLETKASS